MNSRQNNEKIIEILSEMEPIHDETEEEKKQREQMIKNASENLEEPPLAFPRKVATIICAALWAFCLLALIFGFADLGVFLPFMMIALAAVCVLNIPAFYKKGKTGDVIMAVIAAALCVAFAIGILVIP